MGMAKRPHIAALFALPRIAAAWTEAHGRAPTEADIDAVYEVFVPRNAPLRAEYADAHPGRRRDATALRAAA